MKIEYILLNILIFSGPFFLSFDRKVHYFRYWLTAFLSIGIVMIPFIIWDSAVSGSHWHFNENFTISVRIWGLPPGDWMFFISVPFSCLFVWQIIVTDMKILFVQKKKILYYISVAFLILSFSFLFFGKIYSSLVCFAIAFTIIFDMIMKTNLLSQKQAYLYLAILTALIMIFNGYLTARPVVLYNSQYVSNIKIWTIPIEDFGYGYTFILLCTIIFEKLKGFSNA